MIVRSETEQDFAAIRDINRAAFMGDAEAQLVDDLRASGDVLFSLVADGDGDIAGHIMFCHLAATSEDVDINAAALAPMSVRPDDQSRGVGARLVTAGLERCRQENIDLVVVLGHESYYPRFGFSAETAEKLDAPFSGPAFMALEIRPVLPSQGRVRIKYPSPFGI